MDKRKKECRFRNEKGDAHIISYQVFPGIRITYNSVHTDCCCLETESGGDCIEIHHCREGRMEQCQEEDFFYLMPGDLSISPKKECSCAYHFPLRHYHGVSIIIDKGTAPECFSCFMEDVNIRPAEISKRLCSDGKCFVIRSQDYIDHIFSEVYPLFDQDSRFGKAGALPGTFRGPVLEDCKKGYFKVKILELFLVLSGIPPEENSISFRALSKTQVDLAKTAAVYLSGHMDRQITVKELASRFYVSQTHLQNAFKGVYGVTVQSYVRLLKMQSAALMLVHTDLTVLEVASRCGYDNGSKFASAFRRLMGETPTEYRKMHGEP